MTQERQKQFTEFLETHVYTNPVRPADLKVDQWVLNGEITWYCVSQVSVVDETKKEVWLDYLNDETGHVKGLSIPTNDPQQGQHLYLVPDEHLPRFLQFHEEALLSQARKLEVTCSMIRQRAQVVLQEALRASRDLKAAQKNL